MRGGAIAARGTFSELLQSNKEFSDLLAEFAHKAPVAALPGILMRLSNTSSPPYPADTCASQDNNGNLGLGVTHCYK